MDLGRVITAAMAVGEIAMLQLVGTEPSFHHTTGVRREGFGSVEGKHAFRARTLWIYLMVLVENAYVEELVEWVAMYGTHAIQVSVGPSSAQLTDINKIDAALAGALQGVDWVAVAGRSAQLRLKVRVKETVLGHLPLTAAACEATAGVVTLD